MARTFYLISYDVTNDRTRARIAHWLEGYGERVQYSVFEVWLTSQEYAQLCKRLAAAVAEEGSIRIYRLCPVCQSNVEILGKGHLTEELKLLFI